MKKYVKSDRNFLFVAYDRKLKLKNMVLYNMLMETIRILSSKYGVITYDCQELLTEEEGLAYTKSILKDPNLKGIIFAVGSDLSAQNLEGTSLKLCLDFCNEKDIKFSWAKRISAGSYNEYGSGFRRYLIALDNPLDVINALNTKYEKFYDVKQICYGYSQSFGAGDMALKISKTINDTMKLGHIKVNFDWKFYSEKLSLNKILIKIVNKESKRRPVLLTANTIDNMTYDFIKRLKHPKNVIIRAKKKNGIDDYLCNELRFSGTLLDISYMLGRSKKHPLYPIASAIKIKNDKSNLAMVDKKTKHKDEITFISYAHINDKNDDKNPISKLAHEMRTAGINVFFDKINFIPGVDWEEIATETIKSKRCKKMLCIATREYFKSTACKLEIENMISTKGKELIIYDLFGQLDSIDDQFVKSLVKLRNVKVVRSRKDLLSCYKLKTLEKNMERRIIKSNYSIISNKLSGEVFPKTYYLNSKGYVLRVTKIDKQIYATANGVQIPLTPYKTDPEKFFYNNEKSEIFKPESGEKEEYDYKRLYGSVKRKSKGFMVKAILILTMLFLAVYAVFSFGFLGELSLPKVRFSFLPDFGEDLLNGLIVFLGLIVILQLIIYLDFSYTTKHKINNKPMIIKNILRIPMIALVPLLIVSLIFETKISNLIYIVKKEFDNGNVSYVQIVEKGINA